MQTMWYPTNQPTAPTPPPVPPSRTSGARSLGVATGLAGLMAGLYFAYSVSVMPGLGRTDDLTFLRSMQEINRAIQNPVFFLVFVGALVAAVVAVVQQRNAGRREVLRWVAVAAVAYGLTLIVTMAANVPLNDQLNKVDLGHVANPAAVRAHFETRWVAWNIVRTVISVASFAGFVVAGHRLTQARFEEARRLGR